MIQHGHYQHRWLLRPHLAKTETPTSDKYPTKTIKHAQFTYHINNVQRHYKVSLADRVSKGSLIDRGANGGLCGSEDTRPISYDTATCTVDGIGDYRVSNVKIGTFGAYAISHRGPVIVIMHQYAEGSDGSTTIHSPKQMENWGCKIHDTARKHGGHQGMITPDGYAFPFKIRDGLVQMEMRKYTDDEFDALPHVFLTADTVWDPRIDDDESDDQHLQDLGNLVSQDNDWNKKFDEQGKYRLRTIGTFAVTRAPTFMLEAVHYNICNARLVNQMNTPRPKVQDTNDEGNDNDMFKDVLDQYYDKIMNKDTIESIMHIHDIEQQQEERDQQGIQLPKHAQRIIKREEPDFESMRPKFGWMKKETIKKTFAHTTQMGKLPAGEHLYRQYKSPNPAFNVHRRQEGLATDTVFSDTPAVDSGVTIAQLYFGMDTHVTDVFGMKLEKQFVNTLEDVIRKRGAPTRLISDRAQVEVSNRALDILRALLIGDWQSEPNKQWLNPAERRYQTVKRMTNKILDYSGAPDECWLLAMQYVCYLLNHTSDKTIGDITPLEALLGITPDISVLLRFFFYEKVYYAIDDTAFPSESNEAAGWFVGISESVGNAMTYKILTSGTNKVISRSAVRSAETAPFANKRADLDMWDENDEDSIHEVVKSKHVIKGNTNMAEITFNPEEIIGRTFLMPNDEDGTKKRIRVAEMIDVDDPNDKISAERIKFRCQMGSEDKYDEILTYEQLMDMAADDEFNQDVVWKFRRIVGHEGPLTANHHNYKGSSYNVLLEWENGEVTPEPLSMIAKDDPVTCAVYAKDNDLLNTPGWKQFKRLAKRQKQMIRMINQAKLKSYKRARKYMYGYPIPTTYQEALEFDRQNGNSKWDDATGTEMEQLDLYSTFVDLGVGTEIPEGYKKIRTHLVYAVKHDGRFKARMVADGHLTDTPLESVYSGVVSLRSLRIVLFLAELNGLDAWATDVGNAYLEATTNEKVAIIAGPEFGNKAGHTLIIHKALYGLKLSGKMWYQRFADCLKEMGFTPSKADPCIWMKLDPNNDVYEYVAVYVDDLAFVMKDPAPFVETLTKKYQFKLKGTGSISFHLGCDFFRDEDGVLCMAPRKYIEKMESAYERMFGQKPRQKYTSPLEKGDHPETDTTDFLDDKGINDYQSLIGMMQWAISLGRFDIHTAVMTMSSYTNAPRIGHLDRARRICGYLCKMRHATIRFRHGTPDYSGMTHDTMDWRYSVYGELDEIIPQDAPEPKGRPITLTHYVDANLYHNLLTGRSVTGILHLINQTPIDWFSKKQATVETATYGAEFVAARTCVDQIIDLRNTLRYLGVPVNKYSYMFGDNESVVKSSTIPESKLHKRHNALSYHRVREAISQGYIIFKHLVGTSNPADILSKHWGYRDVWPLLRTILFFRGDTINAIDDANDGRIQEETDVT